jgi:hypothetical protein
MCKGFRSMKRTKLGIRLSVFVLLSLCSLSEIFAYQSKIDKNCAREYLLAHPQYIDAYVYYDCKDVPNLAFLMQVLLRAFSECANELGVIITIRDIQAIELDCPKQPPWELETSNIRRRQKMMEALANVSPKQPASFSLGISNQHFTEWSTVFDKDEWKFRRVGLKITGWCARELSMIAMHSFSYFFWELRGSEITNMTLKHELGHLLGLDHSEDPRSIMSPQVNEITTEWTDEDIAQLKRLRQMEASTLVASARP